MPQVAIPRNRSLAKLVYLLKDAQRKRDGSFKIFSIREPTLKEPVAAHYGNGARLNILAHLCKMSVKNLHLMKQCSAQAFDPPSTVQLVPVT